MTVHLQMKKTEELSRLRAELQKLEAKTGGNASDALPGVAGSPEIAPAEAAPRGVASRRGSVAAPATAAPQPVARTSPSSESSQGDGQPSSASVGPTPQPRWETPTATARAVGRPSTGPASTRTAKSTANPAAAHAPQQPHVVETALWPGTALSAADPMRDQWAFRPREGGGETTIAEHDPSIPARATASTIDTDLETVQRKIKALADEVNAAEYSRERSVSMPASASIPSSATSSAIERSIGALKATAESMRAAPKSRSEADGPSLAPTISNPPAQPFDSGPVVSQAQSNSLPTELLIPDTAQRIAVSEPLTSQPAQHRAPAGAAGRNEPVEPILELPPLPVLDFPPPSLQPNPRLTAILAAIESGQLDVFLSPIVALQSHQVSHYDVTVRVKAANGSYMDHAEQELQLAGGDMLALFDTARLQRAALLSQRLDAHNKSGSLLSSVNAPSITNAGFLETFARVYEERQHISNQLVLTFSQSDIEQFSPSAWQALRDMHAFGFRFAMSDIDHLDFDFADLNRRGFAFLRLQADALIHGLPARDRFIEAGEVCSLLAGAGMTLIADTIEDEAIRARVFGFGVLFGQGRLFGGARLVKLDPLPRGAPAAA